MFNIYSLPQNVKVGGRSSGSSSSYRKGDTVVIIDGDVLCYKVASSSEKSFIMVKNKLGKEKKFKNKTEFKKWCEDRGKDFNDYTWVDGKDVESLEYCLGTLKRAIANIVKFTKADYYELYIEGSGCRNFRCELPLIDKYKDRDHSNRPDYLTDCKEYVVNHSGAIVVMDRETDDVFQQRLYELTTSGIDAIGYTIDKDASQNYQFDIAIYNPDHAKIHRFKKGIGSLWETSAGIKGSGLKWLMFQTLLYDRIDNYCLNQFYKKSYGEKSFFKDIEPLKTEKEVLEKCVDILKTRLPEVIEYKSWNGVDMKLSWLELANLYFSCAYMLIADNDETTFESLLIEYGVDCK